MTDSRSPMLRISPYPARRGVFGRFRRSSAAGVFASALVLAGCGTSSAPEEVEPDTTTDQQETTSQSDPTADEGPTQDPVEEPAEQPAEAQSQEETCDWDSPRLSGPADVPDAQTGELSEVLVGAWQHTHTDEGSGFEEVTNDHRYVFPAPERMLYCQHVPGVTEHAENAADVVLNGTAIELPGGEYSYTITAWDEDTLVWDNPVGGGYIYLLQRR